MNNKLENSLGIAAAIIAVSGLVGITKHTINQTREAMQEVISEATQQGLTESMRQALLESAGEVMRQEIEQEIKKIQSEQEDMFKEFWEGEMSEPEEEKEPEPDCDFVIKHYDPQTGQGVVEIHCKG